MDYYYHGLIFIIGAIFGSFINVIIYRIPRKISLLHPGSFCDVCKKQLRWHENVPVVSYLLQLGKCRHCDNRYSPRYLIIELIHGVVSVLIYSYAIDVTHFIFLSFIIMMFISMCLIDIKHFILPDKLLIATALASIAYYVYIEGAAVTSYLLSALIIFGVLMLLRWGSKLVFKQEAFGLGDVKLGTLIGFLLGWQAALIAMFFGFLIAGFIIFILMLFKKIDRKSYLPFGPFIISGMFTYVLFGQSIIQWYLHLVFAH